MKLSLVGLVPEQLVVILKENLFKEVFTVETIGVFSSQLSSAASDESNSDVVFILSNSLKGLGDDRNSIVIEVINRLVERRIPVSYVTATQAEADEVKALQLPGTRVDYYESFSVKQLTTLLSTPFTEEELNYGESVIVEKKSQEVDERTELAVKLQETFIPSSEPVVVAPEVEPIVAPEVEPVNVPSLEPIVLPDVEQVVLEVEHVVPEVSSTNEQTTYHVSESVPANKDLTGTSPASNQSFEAYVEEASTFLHTEVDTGTIEISPSDEVKNTISDKPARKTTKQMLEESVAFKESAEAVSAPEVLPVREETLLTTVVANVVPTPLVVETASNPHVLVQEEVNPLLETYPELVVTDDHSDEGNVLIIAEGDEEPTSTFGMVDANIFSIIPEEPVETHDETKAREEALVAATEKLRLEASSIASFDRFSPPVETYSGYDAKTIVVASLSSGSGSTFLVREASGVIAESGITVSAIEYLGNKPTMFQYMNGDKFKPDRWQSIASRVETLRPVSNLDYWERDGVNWFPIGKNAFPLQVQEEHVTNYMRACKISQYNFLDISTNWKDEALISTLDSCSEIWAVLTPSIGTMFDDVQNFKQAMEPWADKVKFVLNKADDYTSSNEVLDSIDRIIANPKEFLLDPTAYKNTVRRDYYEWRDKSIDTVVRMFPTQLVNKAEWDGLVFSQTEDGYDMVRDKLDGLLNIMVPDRDYIPMSKPKGSLFTKLFKRSTTTG